MRSLCLLGNDSRRDTVDPHREVRLGFGGVHLRICRCIHNEVGTLTTNEAADRVRVGEVERGAIGCHYFTERE